MASYIKLTNVNVEGINLYDSKRKLWHGLFNSKAGRIDILKNINFEAKNGDRIGILGKNGHGKSSLMKVLWGIYPPKSGSVAINGRISAMLEAGKGSSVQITAAHAVKMSFVYNNMIEQYNSDIAKEIFEFAGLIGHESKPVIQFSSGMLVRLMISCALFQVGDIGIFDEPFVMTDKAFMDRAMNKVNVIWHDLDIGLYISHNLEEVERLCDKCYIVHQGSILDYGNTSKMIEVYNRL